MFISSSLTIDRTSLSLLPLVLNNNPFDPDSPFTYPEDGLSEPTFPPRVTWAPDSQWIPGRLALGSVIDSGTIQLGVTVRGDSTNDLQVNKVALMVALAQISYSVTMEVGGVEIGTWDAMPGSVAWGLVDHGMAAAYLARGEVSIPVNPPTASEES